MATIKIFLGMLCLACIGSSSLCGSGIVKKRGYSFALPNQQTPAQQILSEATKEIGVREKTGYNDGERVESYLHYVQLQKGAAWCAAFVSWVYGQAGYAQPRTGWSPALFPLSKRRLKAQPAMVFGIYFPELKRIAHCGLVEKQQGNWIITIEGNTNSAGSRAGDGVYRKRRALNTVKYFANWLPEKGVQHER